MRGGTSAGCSQGVDRKRELVHIVEALRPLRVPAWPYRGPVGIRERSDVHVVDQWQFLGTARSDSDLQAILECRPDEFDPRTYRVLRRTLAHFPGAGLSISKGVSIVMLRRALNA